MDISTLIAKNSVWIALAIVIFFLFYKFYLEPKYLNKKEPDKTNSGEKENPMGRMARGFKVMGDKVRNSNYVKGMSEEEKNTNWQDLMPKSLSGDDKQEDVFSTDLSKIGNVKI